MNQNQKKSLLKLNFSFKTKLIFLINIKNMNDYTDCPSTPNIGNVSVNN